METKQFIERFHEKRKHIDKTFWVLMLGLVIVSILSLFSSSSHLINAADGNIYKPIFSHALTLLVGIGIAYVIQFLPSWAIRLAGYVGLFFSIICLFLTFSPLGVEINGETRWIRLFGITFQPSEPAKITLIIVVADLLSRIKSDKDKAKYYLIVLALTGIVCGIILPTNLSTALLIGIVVFILMWLARIPSLWLGGLAAFFAAILISGYIYVDKRYIEKGEHMTGRFKRAETWVGRFQDKFADDTDTQSFHDNYQANIAQIAVAHGSQSPFGVLPGNSWAREKLPQAYSDFIFAIIVEEMGIVGSVLLIGIYLFILFRACRASSKYADYSAMLMMMGLALMVTTQAFISMEVSVGLGPVTGQPLPLISDGSTSVLFCCFYFGIMMAVSREQNEKRSLEEASVRQSSEIVPEIENID